jgi:hypothetical protein
MGCGGDNRNSGNTGSDSTDMEAKESRTDLNGNRTDMPAQTRELTGCLLAGGDAGSFVLQLGSSTPATNSNASGAATSGSPAATSAAGSTWVPGATYRVMARNGEDLSAHLNKMVAVNGSIEGGTAGAVGTAGNQRPSNLPSDSSELGTVRVESVRQVADQCPAGATTRRPTSR